MAEFNIDRDITPLRGNYFPSSLTMGEIGGLERKYGSELDAELDRSIKLMDAVDRRRDRDLAYQAGLERIYRERERAQRERDEDARIGDLGKILQGMEGTPEERKGELLDLRLTNPELFSSRGASNLYGAALGKITLEEEKEAKEKAKAKAEADRLAKLYGTDPEKLREKYGELDQFEQENIETATVLQGRAQSEAEKQWNLKNLESQKKQLEDVESVLTGVKDRGDDNSFSDTKGGKFKSDDRRKLQFSLLQMGRGQLKIEDIRKMDDDELYDSVLGKYQQGLQQYEGYRKQYSPIRDNTTNTNERKLHGLPQ